MTVQFIINILKFLCIARLRKTCRNALQLIDAIAFLDVNSICLYKEPEIKEPVESSAVRYCLCREPERPGMIGCDYCEEWYHISCLNLKREEVRELTKCKWMCPKCELKDKKMTKGKYFLLLNSLLI